MGINKGVYFFPDQTNTFNKGVSFLPDLTDPFVAKVGQRTDNYFVDKRTGFALPRSMEETINDTRSAVNTATEGLKTIEIAGKIILAMPLEAMAFTPEQQENFKEAGGLMNPLPKVATAEKGQDKMMYWIESFETLQGIIDGVCYSGFRLFRKVYAAFPDICSMTQEEAKAAGLYPNIHYRNFAAGKWLAEKIGGELVALDFDYRGDLLDIYNATEGKTNLERLAAMGQAPFGCRNADDGRVNNIGNRVRLGSTGLNRDGTMRALRVRRGILDVENDGYWPKTAVSFVVAFKQ